MKLNYREDPTGHIAATVEYDEFSIRDHIIGKRGWTVRRRWRRFTFVVRRAAYRTRWALGLKILPEAQSVYEKPLR